ncbi:MAG: GGDEF domain-containing protein [Gammaproteobacteria bacterium]|nr:GGDEF domain-containing protein [Gammaproteobacteria bacterium]
MSLYIKKITTSASLTRRLKISMILTTLPLFLLAGIGLFLFQKSTNAFNDAVEGIVTDAVPVTELKDKIQQTVVPFNHFINRHQLDDKTKFLQLSRDIKKSLANSIKFEQKNHSLTNDIYRSAYLKWRNAERIADKIFNEVDRKKVYISYYLLQDFYQYVIETTLALDKVHLAMQDRVNIRYQKAKELRSNTLILSSFIFLLIYITTIISTLVLHRSIIKPIKKLELWANNFSRHQKNHQLLTLDSYKEFEFIASTYNKLCQMLYDDQAVLEQINQKDELTQLNNHHAFLESLKTEHIRHQTYNRPYTIMLINIDHISSINENYSPHIGDLSLIQISKLLEKSIRRTDILSRYYGDSFVVILPEIDKHEANITAERILSSISEHVFKINDFKFGITVSIGLSLVQGKQSLSQDLRCVDFALQKAKRSGRNQIHFCHLEQGKTNDFKLHYFTENDLKLLD